MRHFATAMSLCLAACAPLSAGEDNPLDDSFTDGKADGDPNLTNHHDYFFGTAVQARVKGSTGYHGWQIRLSGSATLDIAAYNASIGAAETAVYLYQQVDESTWTVVDSRGSDGDRDPRLQHEVPGGTYRIIVKGMHEATDELAGMWATCSGAGCPARGSGCLFGEGGMDRLPDAYFDVAQVANVHTLATVSNNPQDQATAAILEAYGAVSGNQQASLSEAFADIQSGSVRSRRVIDSSQTQYQVFEFATSAGRKVAAFYRGESDSQAAIMIGHQMRSCSEAAPVCAFGSKRDDIIRAFDNTYESTRFRDATFVNDLERRQAIKAARVSPGISDITTVDQVLATWGQVTFSEQQDTVSGARYTMVLLHRDDDGTYGLIFHAGTEQVAAQIDDDRIQRCTVTRAP